MVSQYSKNSKYFEERLQKYVYRATIKPLLFLSLLFYYNYSNRFGCGTGCSHYCTDVSISGINVAVYLSEKKEQTQTRLQVTHTIKLIIIINYSRYAQLRHNTSQPIQLHPQSDMKLVLLSILFASLAVHGLAAEGTLEFVSIVRLARLVAAD